MKRQLTINFDPSSLDAPNAVLATVAKKVKKDIDYHFKEYGWPLDYNFLVSDIFYQAFGHHLENYLLIALSGKKKYLLATKEGRTMLDLDKSGGRNAKRNPKKSRNKNRKRVPARNNTRRGRASSK